MASLCSGGKVQSDFCESLLIKILSRCWFGRPLFPGREMSRPVNGRANRIIPNCAPRQTFRAARLPFSDSPLRGCVDWRKQWRARHPNTATAPLSARKLAYETANPLSAAGAPLGAGGATEEASAVQRLSIYIVQRSSLSTRDRPEKVL